MLVGGGVGCFEANGVNIIDGEVVVIVTAAHGGVGKVAFCLIGCVVI